MAPHATSPSTFTSGKQRRNTPSVAFDAVDVALVRWPSERERWARLRDAQHPRLLLVEEGTPPPIDDCLEDWIRGPADGLELAQRVGSLRVRAGIHGADGQPALDDDGVLRLGAQWVSLPPVEARLTAALLERVGAVVSREALSRAGWPTGAPG